MVNTEGRRYLQDYDLGEPVDVSDPRHPQLRSMELGPRDKLSQAFMKEQDAGRVFPGEYGTYVHLDVRHLGEQLIDERIPFVRELAKNYAGIDPVHEPIPVRPVVHYMMGGIHTDLEGATTLPGLYAAGECACVSINGANRLGSNSLTELLVFGRRAGHAAAVWAQEHPELPVAALDAQAADEQARIASRYLTPREGGERIAAIRQELNATMEEGVGVYRDQARLEATTKTIDGLKERAQHVALDDHSKSFNTELTAALELEFLLDIGEAVAPLRARPHRVAWLAPAHRLPRPRRRGLPQALAQLPHRRRPAHRLRRRHDHQLAPGRADLRELADVLQPPGDVQQRPAWSTYRPGGAAPASRSFGKPGMPPSIVGPTGPSRGSRGESPLVGAWGRSPHARAWRVGRNAPRPCEVSSHPRARSRDP